jgi:D-alanyl-lipoteichoic acid acyltransferase DltB (MBOAT superfamily)
MLFNSFNFAIFLPIVFILYWFATKGNLRLQNILLFVSSYFFYACWDWRFLFLLVFSIFLNYFTGIKIQDAESQNFKKFWLWFSTSINLGFLGIFKYYNFFASSFADSLLLLGIKADFMTLQVILPVGISFYTFIGLSYIIDIYKNRVKPEKNFIDFSVFVSFFPLILAGPIERATHLLPQILKKREFDYSKAVDGLRQILWGLFKKVVIADNCAEYANTIFNNSADYSGSTLVLGALFFTVQIYCDFSGYSDIALGIARLFGIDLLRNFAFPYFSRDIAEFWKRWHISLSSWFRDYVFLPIAYSVSRNIKSDRFYFIKTDFIIYAVGISITWILTGFWHGANYTFIVWGAIHASLLIIHRITLKPKKRLLKSLNLSNNNKILIFIETIATFIIVMFSWIFFRADNVEHAVNYISEIFSKSIFTFPSIVPDNIIILIGIFLIIEWIGRENQYAIQNLGSKWHRSIRWAMYYFIFFVILYFGGSKQQFIYFQF